MIYEPKLVRNCFVEVRNLNIRENPDMNLTIIIHDVSVSRFTKKDV